MTLFVYSLLAFILSLGIVIFIMPFWIDYLKKVSFNQNVSEYSLQEYKDKAKTPIMGGVIFILVPVFLTILFNWNQLHSLRLWILLLSFVGYGLIGFVDDYLIVVKHNNDGLKPRYKFLLQVLLAIIFFLIYQREADLSITLLFSKRIIPLGIFYGPLVLLMFSGASNAVNLTDGMDGLAAGCMVTALVPFWIYALIQKEFGIAVFVAALLGALFGYLKFNIKPAKIFMGDTGSLALGAVLAALAMLLKKEMALIVIGGIFVIETLCVMIQIGSVKLRGKRVFPYTPIHYAFVIKGMGERQVVHWFWLVSLGFAIIGFFLGL
ncbi:MAG: phospho-N-acetylmuramoyl-pentapeptide-transferase [Solobacterium sp.]|nr:phospho-N-acetylmuramoyl-pentapeptide-transferase [Solobacterium sp.]